MIVNTYKKKDRKTQRIYLLTQFSKFGIKNLDSIHKIKAQSPVLQCYPLCSTDKKCIAKTHIIYLQHITDMVKNLRLKNSSDMSRIKSIEIEANGCRIDMLCVDKFYPIILDRFDRYFGGYKKDKLLHLLNTHIESMNCCKLVSEFVGPCPLPINILRTGLPLEFFTCVSINVELQEEGKSVDFIIDYVDRHHISNHMFPLVHFNYKKNLSYHIGQVNTVMCISDQNVRLIVNSNRYYPRYKHNGVYIFEVGCFDDLSMGFCPSIHDTERDQAELVDEYGNPAKYSSLCSIAGNIMIQNSGAIAIRY